MQKLKTEQVLLNKEIASMFLKGVEEILDGIELLTNPNMLKTLDKRIKEVKAGKRVKSMSHFEDFMRRQGVLKK